MLSHHVLQEAWAIHLQGFGPKDREEWQCFNAETQPSFWTSPPLRLEPGIMLGSCAKIWEVCCSFMQKFPSGARCLAGQSGFQAALGGGLLRQFFCLPFPGIFPEWGGNSFAFVKFPLSVRLLRKDFLEILCAQSPDFSSE